MRILIKLGGTLVDSPDSLHRLAAEITEASRGDHEIAVVHGGGKQMTRFLTERGVESKFVNGLRVTTPEVIDAVVKVFTGSVNAQLVTAFRAAGALPVGLSGLSAGLVDAEVLNPELGMVGKPVHSDARLLHLLVKEGYLPVIACVAGDPEGRIFNVNADQMAVACAVSYQAQKLLFLTDVEGVRDGAGVTREVLTVAEARELIQAGVATGGMQAKLEAAISPLEASVKYSVKFRTGGVKEVLIAPGGTPEIITQMLQGNNRIGTRIVL